MPEALPARLTVVSLNTRGAPMTGSRLADRCAVIGAALEAGGADRRDALLAALAEHLATQYDLAPPAWTEPRVLRQPWFPAETRVQRADALARAPAAFRKQGFTCRPPTLKPRD